MFEKKFPLYAFFSIWVFFVGIFLMLKYSISHAIDYVISTFFQIWNLSSSELPWSSSLLPTPSSSSLWLQVHQKRTCWAARSLRSTRLCLLKAVKPRVFLSAVQRVCTGSITLVKTTTMIKRAWEFAQTWKTRLLPVHLFYLFCFHSTFYYF